MKGGRPVLRWAYVAVAALLTAAIVVPNVRMYRTENGTDAVVAQLRHLREALDDGSAARAQRLFPEGHLFSYALYGLTWVDVATADTTRRVAALREARWALSHLDSPAGRAPFAADQRPAYGVFYAGWTTRLRGGVLQLAGPDAPERAAFTEDCAALAEAFDAGDPFLTAYPGQAWPVDSVVAMAALALHDRLRLPGESDHADTVARWVRAARERVDPTTGLLPHQAAPTPTGARGSSQSVIQRFLVEVDPDWAHEQYGAFRRTFVTTRLGLPVVLEYPRGTPGAGDVDSGPLVLGVSTSATVVTLGAARAHGDLRLAGRLTGLGEAAGAPVGIRSKRYALGQLPVGEAFLAWSAAAAPVVEDPPAYADVVSVGWRLPWHALGLAVIALLWTPCLRRVVGRSARRRRADRSAPHSR